MKKKVKELSRIKTDLEKFMTGYCEAIPGKANDYVGESCSEAMSMLQDTLSRMHEEIDKTAAKSPPKPVKKPAKKPAKKA
ncbi:MAG: hypothetical protein A2516_00815 [Alphaproteobacteria bacterium RIFOXYD12_FULL_60_8]|nr:MAG: hypothetical protein A2516_00815 [Alphaproteobacteria bacterium RIFOXYD12_FULL_60_8]